MSNRLDQEREAKLQPERMEYAVVVQFEFLMLNRRSKIFIIFALWQKRNYPPTQINVLNLL